MWTQAVTEGKKAAQRASALRDIRSAIGRFTRSPCGVGSTKELRNVIEATSGHGALPHHLSVAKALLDDAPVLSGACTEF